jgi:hypothetical protein
MIKFVIKCDSCENTFEENINKNVLQCLQCVAKKVREIERLQEPLYIKKIKADILLRKNIVCIGPAGSGKSYALREITKELDESDIPIYFDVICPTGNSALNVSGITYHTLFGWRKHCSGDLFFNISSKSLSNKDYDNDILKNKINEPRYKACFKRILELEILIFDEFSMISNVHFQSMNRICQLIRNSSEAFGGIKLILFGDPFQLRPIMGEYLFVSEEWDYLNFTVHELEMEHMYRFVTSEFSDMTRMLRLGIISDKVIEKFQERLVESPKKIMELYFTNKDVDISNQSEYDKINMEESFYTSSLIAKYNITRSSDKKFKIEVIRHNFVGNMLLSEVNNKEDGECVYSSCNSINVFNNPDDKVSFFSNTLKSVLNTYRDQITKYIVKDLTEFSKNLKNVYGENFMKIKIKPGTRVICTVNNKEDGQIIYANGTTGIVKECLKDSVILELDDNRVITIFYKTIEHTRRFNLQSATDYNYTIDLKFSFQHIPLRLGYACTISKAQGMTMDMVKISGKGLRKSCGIMYVSMSRCRDIKNMYLDGIDFSKIVASSIAISKFRDHFTKEINRLIIKYPEWFIEYYVNIDSNMEIQKVNNIIYSARLNQEYRMPDISSDTQKIVTTMSRGSSQSVLRNWLLKYQKSCLVTNESIPQLLEAAHIKEYNKLKHLDNAHQNNAVLLRVDIHKLFDNGMMSFEDNGNILWCKSIQEHGVYSGYVKVIFPVFVSLDYVLWHRNNVFDVNK